MKMLIAWALLGSWLEMSQPPFPKAGENESPKKAREVVEKAIQAHGGLETLMQARLDRVQMRGTMMMAKPSSAGGAKPEGEASLQAIPFEAETVTNLPDGFKNRVILSPGSPGQMTMVQLQLKGKMALYANGIAQSISPAQIEEFRETLFIQQAMRLVSLVKDPSFVLEWEGSGSLNERPVDWVLVKCDRRRPLRMTFDQGTGYLVRTSHLVLVGGTPVIQEETYGDFRKLGAYTRPVKMVTTRGGRPLIDAEIVDVRYPQKISEAEFLTP